MLLSLAKELKVLPDELNRLLIIVVVLSMALTPFLAELGKTVAEGADNERLSLASVDGVLPTPTLHTSSCFQPVMMPVLMGSGRTPQIPGQL